MGEVEKAQGKQAGVTEVGNREGDAQLLVVRENGVLVPFLDPPTWCADRLTLVLPMGLTRPARLAKAAVVI